MNPYTWVSILTAVVALVGAPIAYAKLRGERTNIWITAAKGAVVVQGDVIDDLRDQITDLRQRVHEQDDQAENIRQLTRQVKSQADQLRTIALQRDRLQLDNDRLRARVGHLEQIVRDAGLDPDN